MSKDLKQRLLDAASGTECPNQSLEAKAHDRIEELERENEALAKNLRGKHSITGATYAHLIYQRDALQADNARLREAIAYGVDNSDFDGETFDNLLRGALAATDDLKESK